jgi:hypothetical protein
MMGRAERERGPDVRRVREDEGGVAEEGAAPGIDGLGEQPERTGDRVDRVACRNEPRRSLQPR